MGTFRCDLSMREFSEWIHDLGLIDIPLHGIIFTWRRNESKSKLDKGLCCDVWFRKFPGLNLVGKKRSVSDHNPLVLSLESLNNWGPKLFKSYDAWFLNPEFKKFVKDEWKNLPNVSLINKLKALKGPLRVWSKKHFAQLDGRISELETVIHDLEILSDQRELDGLEMTRLKAAQSLLSSYTVRRERIWRQKARSYGLSMKDRNTNFFTCRLCSGERRMRSPI